MKGLFLSEACYLISLISESAKNAEGTQEMLRDHILIILKQTGKLESQSPTKEGEGLREVIIGVSTIFSHLGRQDDLHWQVLDY